MIDSLRHYCIRYREKFKKLVEKYWTTKFILSGLLLFFLYIYTFKQSTQSNYNLQNDNFGRFVPFETKSSHNKKYAYNIKF